MFCNRRQIGTNRGREKSFKRSVGELLASSSVLCKMSRYSKHCIAHNGSFKVPGIVRSEFQSSAYLMFYPELVGLALTGSRDLQLIYLHQKCNLDKLCCITQSPS